MKAILHGKRLVEIGTVRVSGLGMVKATLAMPTDYPTLTLSTQNIKPWPMMLTKHTMQVIMRVPIPAIPRPAKGRSFMAVMFTTKQLPMI